MVVPGREKYSGSDRQAQRWADMVDDSPTDDNTCVGFGSSNTFASESTHIKALSILSLPSTLPSSASSDVATDAQVEKPNVHD